MEERERERRTTVGKEEEEERGNLGKCVYTTTPDWAGPGRCEMFGGAIVLKRPGRRQRRQQWRGRLKRGTKERRRL